MVIFSFLKSLKSKSLVAVAVVIGGAFGKIISSLIDDVITTGATLEACYGALCHTKNLKISIACMAYTK